TKSAVVISGNSKEENIARKRRKPGRFTSPAYASLFLFCYSALLLSVSCVYVYQFLQVFVSLHSFLLVDREQSCSLLRICSLKSIVTYLSIKECLIVFLLRSLAVKEELVALSSRIEPEVVPVSALYCELFLCLRLAHTFLDTVVDTRSVSNDQ